MDGAVAQADSSSDRDDQQGECMLGADTIERAEDEAPFLSEEEALVATDRLHEEMGHPGIRKTLAACRQQFRADKLWKIVDSCIKGCEVCQKYKTHCNGPTKREPLYKRQTVRPGELLAVDLMDLGRTPRGNCALLVAVDLHSKFGYGIPLRSKKSAAVADALERVVFVSSVHVPDTILSDNGPEFRGEPFKQMLDRYGIKSEHSIPYLPQSNGAVERLNRTLKARLAATLDGDYSSWDLAIHKVIVQYNRTVHDETKKTPVSFYTEHNEAPVLSGRSRVWRQAGKDFTPYSVGTLVLKKVPGQLQHTRHKFAPRYEGPYRVSRVVSSLTYEIEQLQGRRKAMTVHFSQLKLFHGEVTHKANRVREHKRKAREDQVPVTVGVPRNDYSWLYCPDSVSVPLPMMEDGNMRHEEEPQEPPVQTAVRGRLASTPCKDIAPRIAINELSCPSDILREELEDPFPEINFDTTSEGSFVGFDNDEGLDLLRMPYVIRSPPHADESSGFGGFEAGNEIKPNVLSDLRRVIENCKAMPSDDEPSNLRAVTNSLEADDARVTSVEMDSTDQCTAISDIMRRGATVPSFTYIGDDIESWSMEDLGTAVETLELPEDESAMSDEKGNLKKSFCCIFPINL